jgi:hypothetical protein
MATHSTKVLMPAISICETAISCTARTRPAHSESHSANLDLALKIDIEKLGFDDEIAALGSQNWDALLHEHAHQPSTGVKILVGFSGGIVVAANAFSG